MLCNQMPPDDIALTIELDLGNYQFKYVRLTTKYDERRLHTIRTEVIELIQSLDNVISYEIGEVYQVQRPKDEERPCGGEAGLDGFLEKHPTWQWDALWAEGIG